MNSYIILIMVTQICQALFKCCFQPLKCEILLLFFVLDTVIVWFWTVGCAKQVTYLVSRIEVTGRKKKSRVKSIMDIKSFCRSSVKQLLLSEQSSCDPALLLLFPTCNKSITLDSLQDSLLPDKGVLAAG